MKSSKWKKSKLTMLFAVIAVLLFLSGGYMGTRAQLTIESQDYKADFALDHLAVSLMENGNYTASQDEKLIQYMDGTVDPGRTYTEEIAAHNDRDIDQYLRLTIRKYWMKDGVKDPSKDPALIELTYDDKAYNNGPWQINKKESTAESNTYYYSTVLGGSQPTEPVVNKLRVSDRILDDMTIEEKEGETKYDKVYVYHYDYDGYDVCLEADVQALQTHNINDAIKGIWGVQNVTVSDGKLTVGN